MTSNLKEWQLSEYHFTALTSDFTADLDVVQRAQHDVANRPQGRGRDAVISLGMEEVPLSFIAVFLEIAHERCAASADIGIVA